MDKKDIKEGAVVVDRWSPNKGVGVIKNIKKTKFNVNFNAEEITYDYPHAAFLDLVLTIKKVSIKDVKGENVFFGFFDNDKYSWVFTKTLTNLSLVWVVGKPIKTRQNDFMVPNIDDIFSYKNKLIKIKKVLWII